MVKKLQHHFSSFRTSNRKTERRVTCFLLFSVSFVLFDDNNHAFEKFEVNKEVNCHFS
jgi:hypothetical protein